MSCWIVLNCFSWNIAIVIVNCDAGNITRHHMSIYVCTICLYMCLWLCTSNKKKWNKNECQAIWSYTFSTSQFATKNCFSASVFLHFFYLNLSADVIVEIRTWMYCDIILWVATNYSFITFRIRIVGLWTRIRVANIQSFSQFF